MFWFCIYSTISRVIVLVCYSRTDQHQKSMPRSNLRMSIKPERYSDLLPVSCRDRKPADRRGDNLAGWFDLGLSRTHCRSNRWKQRQASGRSRWDHHQRFQQHRFLRSQQRGMAYINCISSARLWRSFLNFFQLSSYIRWNWFHTSNASTNNWSDGYSEYHQITLTRVYRVLVCGCAECLQSGIADQPNNDCAPGN